MDGTESLTWERAFNLKWTEWTIGKKLAAGFSLVVLAVIILGALSYWNVRNFIDTDRWVIHTHQVLDEIELTLVTMDDAETGARGYVIAGQEEFLQPYTTAAAQIDGHIENLTTLTADNPSQQSRVFQLKKDAGERLATLAQVVDTRTKEGFGPAQVMISTGQGNAEMAKVRKDMADMRDEENSLLAERESKSEESARNTLLSFAGLVLLICIMTIAIYRVVRGDVRTRKAAVDAIKQSEQQLFQFLEAVPVAIFVLDASGKPYYANQSAQLTLGKEITAAISPDELSEVYQAYVAGTEEKYPTNRMPIVRALAGERAEVDDIEIHRPDMNVVLQVSATPIFDAGGSLTYAIAAFNDITDQRQLEASLRDLTVRDELTGLYNRRYMMRLLMKEGTRSLRYSHFISLVLLDIDHFKTVNDTWGHPAGDEVLRQVGQLIRDSVRSVDRAVRFGGEEMALILPETTHDEAFALAERVRHAVAEHGFTLRGQGNDHEDCAEATPIRVTISLGVASMPDDADSLSALVTAADNALYDAKRKGRNRTALFSRGTPTAVTSTIPATSPSRRRVH